MAEKTAVSARSQEDLLTNPHVGNACAILAGLSFLLLCMILPLVGPAAVHGSGSPGAGPVPYLGRNNMAFGGVLVLSLVFGVLAVLSKMKRRKIDGSPLPYYTIILVGILVFLLIAFLAGWLGL